MKAVISVLGCDRVGIIASVTGILAKTNVNILDISQTILQNIFTMIMVVDLSGLTVEFAELGTTLQKAGEELGVEIRLQREEIFTSMHRI